MTKKLQDIAMASNAILPVNSSAAITAVNLPLINATGFGRAKFIFNLGVPLSGASFNASIFNATTSGATMALVAGASLATISAAAASCTAVIDMAITPTKFWLSVSAAAANSNYPVAAVVELYNEVSRVQDTIAQQIVVV